jgi:hypothetical protein|nr:MAG TPA: hypothetical protein [Caudoviricetes sp.]
MKQNLDKNTTIKEIVERYLKLENISIYKFSKESKLSIKTIEKILKSTNSNFNKNTIKKLYMLKNLKRDDKKKISLLLKEENKTKNDFKSIEIVLSSLFKENEKLREENKKLETLNLILTDNPKKYNDLLRINSFKTDFETTTKIIPLMWRLNDEVAKLFSELELLLEINNSNENKKMKVGLNKIADNLIEIAKKLKKYAEDEEVEKEIIDMEEK